MDKEELRQQIKAKITKLPSLPSVVTELIRVVSHPTSSASDVEKLLANDISLSIQILKLANSSFYGIPRTISSIRAAVIMLGFNTLKTLILSSSMVKTFPPSKDLHRFDKKLFWKHSLEVAIVSKWLVERLRLDMDKDMMFTSGLLHDVGKLVLEELYPENYPKVLKAISKGENQWEDVENKVLDINHTCAGNILLEYWGVPQSVRDPIIYRHTPLKAELDIAGAHVLHFADCYSRRLCTNLIDGEGLPEFDPNTLTFLKIDPESEEIKDSVLAEFQKASEFFTLIGASI